MRMRVLRFSLVLIVLLCLQRGAFGAQATRKPEDFGFSSERLTRLDAAIQSTIDARRLAGGIMFIARDGETAYLKTYGVMDIEAGKPMPPDAIFRIASMSKAITTTAVMMLYEEGRFRLHDPIEKYLPAFAKRVVAVEPTPETPALPGKPYAIVPARGSITILHLLTHMAGLTYGEGLAIGDYKRERLYDWYFADHDETIGEAMDRLATLPLHGHPGEAWQYGFATDVLGRFVEVVSGQPLDQFFRERIFTPLEMADTCFYLPPEKAARLAPVYGFEDGKLVKKETSETTRYIHGPRKCFSGGAGLLSTVHDYGRFLQMLLNGGELDGVRLLSPKTVELMHANHTGTKYTRDTTAYGLGFWVLDDLGAYGELGTEGSYGWGSAYFPQYLVDPRERMVAFFMAQLRPTGDLDLNQRFKVLVYQALVNEAAKPR
jgi:CubicO group peptidase (beta-lactamase class C family)